MLRMARKRGVEVIRGVAEDLPFGDAALGSILVMTSLCYFDDPGQAFREMHRVLAPGGSLVIGFLGRGGEIAAHYRETEEKGTFLAHATFYTPEEVVSLLSEAGFTGIGEETTGGSSVKGFHVMTATRPGS
jgi:ubiquinone/menaquinone biosynthesis C-methylase UbiE